MMYNEMDTDQKQRVDAFAGIIKNAIGSGLAPDEITAACILILANVNILCEDAQ